MVETTHDFDPQRSTASGPDQGFGRLWRKTYSVSLTGIEILPSDLIFSWKAHFGDFWPGENAFQAPVHGLRPGEVADVELEIPGGALMSTGVRLIFSEPTRFSLAAPTGHIFCGWTTFSAGQVDGVTVAKVEVLMRGSDPIFEFGLEVFGHKREDEFWLAVLRNLANHLGCQAVPTLQRSCVDKRYLFRNSGNIRANSLLRNGIHRAAGPFRSLTSRRATSIHNAPGGEQ